jgi:hypothetical protein
MASSRERRVAKELADIHSDKDNSGVYAEQVDQSDLTHLKGTFPGPPDTPYAGGKFVVDIRIPDTYPFKSPLMRLETKIWHPNVSSVTVSRKPSPRPLPSPSPKSRGCPTVGDKKTQQLEEAKEGQDKQLLLC